MNATAPAGTASTVAAGPASRPGCCGCRLPVETHQRVPRPPAATTPLDDRRGAARRGRAVGPARPRRRGVPDRGQAAHGARRASARAATPWWSPTAKRASPPRSRTGGCCATGRIWCSTDCGWPPGSSARNAPTSTSRTPRRPQAVDDALGRGRLDTLGGLQIVDRDGRRRATSPARRPRRCGLINGGPAKPTDKPPRPFEEGVAGHPDPGQQCRDAGASALHAAPRVRGSSARPAPTSPRAPSWPPSPAQAARRPSTNCRTGGRSPICLRCTVSHRTRCAAR